ncbi:MAG: DegT/DnrJ/EryC1/StrS family aminotransferase [Coriobacteriales bacterium]|jgi:dTDP-4-amino-4,6-dideoxygalactose transaminase|nr:DegT/DnrJ/EryC1/StrS family aminotransferase [Coriobacteriales bacterium]
MQIDFSPPDISEDDIQAVSEVLRSGWITSGPRVQEFEAALAEWTKTPRVAVLNSATAALQCVLELLAIGPGDEVITPAYTYTASASVICHVGASPVLVDVAPGQYQMDTESILAAITPRTKAVIAVDIGGVMCDYNALRKTLSSPQAFRRFAPRVGTMQEIFQQIPIIADAAHSFGSSYLGQPSGTVADFTVFSFHAVKNLTTAEGGAITWRNNLVDEATSAEIYQRIKLYCLHGQTKDALAKSADGAWEYDVVAPLYKCNMTDIAAALGLSQLKRYAQMLERRRQLISLYTEQLQTDAAQGGYSLDILSHDDGHGSVSNGHLMMVRLLGRDDAFRRRFIVKMAEKGVSCNVHFKPLPLLSAYAALGFDISSFPEAFKQYENQVSLPLHTLLSDQDVQYVCDSFKAAYAETSAG